MKKKNKTKEPRTLTFKDVVEKFRVKRQAVAYQVKAANIGEKVGNKILLSQSEFDSLHFRRPNKKK